MNVSGLLKRFIFLWGLLLSLNSCYAQPGISVASWNLENFGRTKSEQTIQFIATTVGRYDVIAIQEVVGHSGGVTAVGRLVAALNRQLPQAHWQYVVSPPTSGNPYQSERYAFVWNDKNIVLAGDAWLDSNYAEVMEREPFLGNFVSAGDTFTLVSFHAVPRKRQPEREIKYLKYFPARYPHLRLIFLGDFNTPQTHNVFHPLKAMGYRPALVSQKTTLKMKCVGDNCLASAYDNIFYPSKRIKLIRAGIIHFYHSFPDMVTARKVSDHAPVICTFSLKP